MMLINFLATVFMTAVILVIQFLHYPGFLYVSADKFAAFHKFHSDRISYIVAPIMLIEIVTAYLLLYYNLQLLNWFNFLSILLIFVLTAFLSVPLHAKLETGYSEAIVKRLILTNWGRTIIWVGRSAVLGCAVFSGVQK